MNDLLYTVPLTPVGFLERALIFCPALPVSIPCFIHLAYSCAMKMKAAGSSETLVRIFQATLLLIPEASNLHSHYRVSLVSSQHNNLPQESCH
jgi:hypothetical protein